MPPGWEAEYQRDVAGQERSGPFTLTEEHKQKNRQLMRQVSDLLPIDDDQKTNDCDLLYRFLIGRHWDVRGAEHYLRQYVQLRAAEHLNGIMAEEIPEAVRPAMSPVYGVDREGHPVLWMTPDPKALIPILKAHPQDALLRAQMHVMESARFVSRVRGVDRCTYVLDLGKITVSSLNALTLGFLRELIKMLQTFYPEIMIRLLVFNTGWAIMGAWKMLKPFVDERVQNKIRFYNRQPDISALNEFIATESILPHYGGTGSGSVLDGPINAEVERLRTLKTAKPTAAAAPAADPPAAGASSAPASVHTSAAAAAPATTSSCAPELVSQGPLAVQLPTIETSMIAGAPGADGGEDAPRRESPRSAMVPEEIPGNEDHPVELFSLYNSFATPPVCRDGAAGSETNGDPTAGEDEKMGSHDRPAQGMQLSSLRVVVRAKSVMAPRSDFYDVDARHFEESTHGGRPNSPDVLAGNAHEDASWGAGSNDSDIDGDNEDAVSKASDSSDALDAVGARDSLTCVPGASHGAGSGSNPAGHSSSVPSSSIGPARASSTPRTAQAPPTSAMDTHPLSRSADAESASAEDTASTTQVSPTSSTPRATVVHMDPAPSSTHGGLPLPLLTTTASHNAASTACVELSLAHSAGGLIIGYWGRQRVGEFRSPTIYGNPLRLLRQASPVTNGAVPKHGADANNAAGGGGAVGRARAAYTNGDNNEQASPAVPSQTYRPPLAFQQQQQPSPVQAPFASFPSSQPQTVRALEEESSSSLSISNSGAAATSDATHAFDASQSFASSVDEDDPSKQFVVGELLRESGHPLHNYVIACDAQRRAQFVIRKSRLRSQVSVYQVVGDATVATDGKARHKIAGQKVRLGVAIPHANISSRCDPGAWMLHGEDFSRPKRGFASTLWAIGRTIKGENIPSDGTGSRLAGNTTLLAECYGQTVKFYGVLARSHPVDLFTLAMAVCQLWLEMEPSPARSGLGSGYDLGASSQRLPR